jgi:hypothetical protein
MQLTTFTDVGIRDDPSYRFVVGPTIAWKPSKNTRLDLSVIRGNSRCAQSVGFRSFLDANRARR